MDEKQFQEIRAKVKNHKAKKALEESTTTQEPKGLIFESVDALIEYLRKD